MFAMKLANGLPRSDPS